MRLSRLSRLSRLAVLHLAALTACGDSTDPGVQALTAYLLTYCSNPPAFAAVQTQSGGPWTKVTLDGTASATIDLGEKFGLATVRQSGTSYFTYISYVTKSELPSATASSCVTSTGSKTLNGSISTLAAGRDVQVRMDGQNAFLTAGGTTSFSLTGITNGAKDLIAQRRVTSTAGEEALIIRRAQDITGGTTMSQLNFATEGVNTASAAVTISGVSVSESRSLYNGLYTVNGLYAFFNSPAATNTAGTVFGLPAAQALSTDMNLTALNVSGSNGGRGVDLFRHTLAAATLDAGPVLSTATVTALSTNPRKLRIQMPSQAEYGKAVEFYYYQNTVGAFRSMDILVTSAFLGGTPTTWDVQPPDLTGVTGYPAAAEFGSATAAYWSMDAFGSMDAYFKLYVNVTEGTAVKWAYQSSSTPVEPPGAALRAASPRSPAKRALLGLRQP